MNSIYINNITYRLHQPVICYLENGEFQGIIKYIGKPDNVNPRFGILFDFNIGSQCNGYLNVGGLVNCSYE